MIKYRVFLGNTGTVQIVKAMNDWLRETGVESRNVITITCERLQGSEQRFTVWYWE